MPSTCMSDEYSNSPRTFGMPSARVVVTPISFGRWTGAGARSRLGRVSGMVLTGAAPRWRGGGGSRGRGEPGAPGGDVRRDLVLPRGAQLGGVHDDPAADEQRVVRARRAED